MIRLAALNDSSCESSRPNEEDIGPSEEALEADATRIYRKAIVHLANDEFKDALHCFLEVLRNPYTEKAVWCSGSERPNTLPQEIALKYSCFKNLGNIYMMDKQYKDAFDYYMKAVQLDSSEVTLWYKLGTAAIKLKDFQFAIIAFQEGLEVNPCHWPCLDQLLSVLFILGFYDDCLGLVINALKRDAGYIKGLAFKDKIFELQPSIIPFVKEFYVHSEILFKDVQYDKVKGEKFVNTCIELRLPNVEQTPVNKVSSQKLQKSFTKLQWVDLADSLIYTYEQLLNEEASAFVGRIELENMLQECIAAKFGNTENSKLKCLIKPGRKLSRSTSLTEDLIRSKSHNDKVSVNDIGSSNTTNDSAPRAKVSCRRQTIELGESKNTFRVGTRRSLSTEIENSNCRSVNPLDDDPKVVHSEELENYNLERDNVKNSFAIATEQLEDIQSNLNSVDSNSKALFNQENPDVLTPKAVDWLETTSLKTQKAKNTFHTTKHSEESAGVITELALILAPSNDVLSNLSVDLDLKDVDIAVNTVTNGNEAYLNPEQKNNLVTMEVENKNMIQSDVINKCSQPNFKDNTVITKEPENFNDEIQAENFSEAAVIQLNDIMALKAPSEIIGLPHPGFDFDNQEDQEFVDEYFDGGVYEDEDDEEVRVDAEAETNEIEANNNFGLIDSSKVNKQNENADEEKDLITKPSNLEINAILTKNVDNLHSEEIDISISEKLQGASEAVVVKPDETNENTIVKKQKRMKRGLERELEQLDYWGRRKAREAKRRRKTLTSRLVGAFEENEYLTWAHLLRSFIPAALLSPDESIAGKDDSSQNTTKQSFENNTCKSSQSEATGKSFISSEESTLAVALNENEVVKEDDKLSVISSGYKDYVKAFSSNLSLWSSEELQVGEFLYKFQHNGGIMDLMQHCHLALIYKYDKIWPVTSALAFKGIYACIRKHILVGATLSKKEDLMRLFSFAKSALANLELLVSLYRVADKINSLKEDTSVNAEELFADGDLMLEDDIFHLGLLLGRPDVWGGEYLQAHFRIQFVQSQIQTALGNPDTAAAHLTMLLEEMEQSTREEDEPIFICRCHVKEDDTIINISYIRSQLNILQRSQLMEKIEDKFIEGCYEEVVEILTSVFEKTNSKLTPEDPIPPRSSQLVFLVESLVKIGNLEDIFNWGAKALSEALGSYKDIESDVAVDKIKWGSTIESILSSFTYLFENRPCIDSETIEAKMPYFLSPLVDILVLQLEQSSGNYPCFNTLAPWLITHYILNEHEQKGEENMEIESQGDNLKENNEDNDVESNGKDKVVSPFPSTLLLITAHEELGKNNWCCHEEGKLLLYMLDVLLAELNRPLSEEQRLLLHQSLEQVIFCLYSHPSRKTKANLLLSTKHKHLRDHGVQAIPLCCNRALQIYKYYFPPQLPDFQSSQVPSISEDNVSFFKKVLLLFSNDNKQANQIEHIDSFLNGNQISCVEHKLNFPSGLIDCYYVIADYYFKNKEWDLAIQYYKLDVSISPDRIDSWAPMGLAKKAQLETLLNSCDVIENEEHFFKEAQMAVRCLERALFLDKYHTNMWVEKGGLVYMIYSHASRLLKQDLNPDLSIERFEKLEKIKEDMMQESIKCFTQTLRIVEQGLDDDSLPDERWLYRYMLGKLAEKSLKPPNEVLDHYIVAAEYLHQNGAKYPSKISYNNPQEYAVEALEMYFRIYTYMFKYLHFREGKAVEPKVLELFSKTVTKVSVSPFVMGAEKKETKSFASADSLTNDTCKVNISSKRALEEDIDNPLAKISKNDGTPEFFIQNLIIEIIEKAVSVSQNKDCLKMKLDNKDDEILVVEEHLEEKESNKIIMKCLEAWKLCITRFSHHYKSLYRISYYYHHSKFHKDNNKARNFLLGSEHWQQLDYMPTNGLFHERKTYLQNPKNCNLFNGVWRIPHDEVDRPGSFAAHMHRCISLCLDILQDTKDFYTVLEVALSLKNSPDKDKKYLRDNERELLSEHSTQVGLQLMKDKFRVLFKNSPSSTSQVNRRPVFLFILDVHKAYRYMSRHLPCIEGPTCKMLTDAYAAFKNIVVENSTVLLREADNWCLRNSLAKRSSLPPNVGYGPNTKTTQSGAPHITGNVKRGRPVGSCNSKEPTPKINSSEQQPSAGQSVAVQQAYKVYENLIQAQTILNSKNLDSKSSQYFQKKYEDYKQQMLKYLQIPSVSQFFHASLQSLGTSAAKLPPPPPIQRSNSVTTTTISKQGNHSLSSLAARSQAHGISISAVSKKAEISVSHPIKPNMSITLSPTKATNKSAKHSVSISQAIINAQSTSIRKDNMPKAVKHSTYVQDDPLAIPTCSITQSSSNQASHAKTTKTAQLSNTISDIPQLKVSKDISIVRTTAQKLSNNSADISSPLPKLPAGTTLSRHSDVVFSKVSTTIAKASTTCKVVEISKISGSIMNRPSNSYSGELPSTKGISKTSVTITPSNRSATADKKQGPVSFQDAFQASIAVANSGLSLNSISVANKSKTESLGSKYKPTETSKISQATEKNNETSKHSSSLTITKTSSHVSQPKVNKLLPDVIPLKLKDPLSTTNEEDEIITLD